MSSTDGRIGWDDEIENDGQFVILPEGDYEFTVVGFERGSFPGSQKTPPCDKATIELSVRSDKGDVSIKTDLIMHRNMEWKLSEFFRSIGQKKHGEKLRMNWKEVPGSKGRAHIAPRKWTGSDGTEKESNDVKKFLDYDPKAMKADKEDFMNIPDNIDEGILFK